MNESIIRKVLETYNDEEYVKFTFNYDIEEIKKWDYNPVRLNIQLTKLCNQRCISCNCGPHISTENELDLNEIKSIIKEVCSKYDIKNIAFTGGEPLIKSNFLEIVEYAKRYSEQVSVTTNAQLIKSVNFAEELLIKGINNITISYHGIGIHDYFTQKKGAEENLKKGLSYVKTAANNLEKSIRIKVGHLLTELSYENLQNFMEFCENEDVELYIEIPMDDIPVFDNKNIEKVKIKDNKKINEIIDLLKKWKKEKKNLLLNEEAIVFVEKYMKKERIESPCPIGFYDIYVDAIGNVYTGCWALPSIGNVRDEKIIKILNSDKLYENLDKMLKRQCDGCTCGYNMMSKYYIPYLIESLKNKYRNGE